MIGEEVLLWIDLETTGLDPEIDEIIEIAWTITDNDLAPVESVESAPKITNLLVQPSFIGLDRIKENLNVFNMHTKSGLLEDIESRFSILPGPRAVQNYILNSILPDKLFMIAGQSVHFDLSFIQRHMPSLAARLSHRVFDVRTLYTFFDSLGLERPVDEPAKKHRAKHDLQNSLDTARGYRDRIINYQKDAIIFQKERSTL